MRTWTAKIAIREKGYLLVRDAENSEHDLLRDQTDIAVREAGTYLLTNDATVEVVLFKTTKARGTERDRSFSVFRDQRGEVRYQ